MDEAVSTSTETSLEVAPLTDIEKIQLANMLVAVKGEMVLSSSYTNWRGETSKRTFRPIALWYGSTEWHPQPGLMLKAHDLEKGEDRDFRVTDFDFSTLKIV